MRIVRAAPDLIETQARGGIGTPLLIGSVLLCWPLVSPFLAVGPANRDRWVAVSVVALIAIGLIVGGWPRRRVVALRPAARTVAVDGGPPIPLSEDAALRLVAAPAQPVSGPMRYGVALENRGMLPLVVLAGADPGKVLGDVARLREHMPLPVQVGWGLPAGSFPWLARTRGTLDGGGLGAWRKDDPVEPTRRRATTALGVGTVAAAALLLMEIRGRASRGDVASPISLVLPAVGILLLVLLTYVMGTLKPRVSAASELVGEWRVGSLPLLRRSVERTKIRRADLVSPSGNAGRHLLVDAGEDGFVAFRCEKDEGARVARIVTGGAR